MKIVTLEELSRMPDGTVFAIATGRSIHAVDGGLMIMRGRMGVNDFNGIMYCTPSPDLNDSGNGAGEYDGLVNWIDTAKIDFDETDTFAVYTEDEILDVVNGLNWALTQMAGGIKDEQ